MKNNNRIFAICFWIFSIIISIVAMAIPTSGPSHKLSENITLIGDFCKYGAFSFVLVMSVWYLLRTFKPRYIFDKKVAEIYEQLFERDNNRNQQLSDEDRIANALSLVDKLKEWLNGSYRAYCDVKKQKKSKKLPPL